MRSFILTLVLGVVFGQYLALGQTQYKVACIGFYNLENLFDTLDTEDVRDAEFTPTGSNRYTGKIYWEKQEHLSTVVSQIGKDFTPDGLAVLGVCEIENRLVLEDFVKQPKLASRNYQIVHFNSRDRRGVDVALLYQEKFFKPETSDHLPLWTRINSNGDTSWSRDILIVTGLLDGEKTTFLVNHWPSRSGGERATVHLRNRAAIWNKKIVDSLLLADPSHKVIVMGDLNDDPINESVLGHLRAQKKVKKVGPRDMYNPWYDFYKRGIGTTAWRDAWSLFDQIIISPSLLKENTNGFRFYQANVYNEPFLRQKFGQYKGYPFRTYSGGAYIGGYSDHFPVYLYLVKEKKE